MRFLLLTSVFVMAFISPVFAKDRTLSVGAFYIPGVIDVNQTGIYNGHLNKVSEKTGIKFELTVYPAARARKLYESGQFDCLMPLDPLFENKHLEHYQSVPFYEANLHIFTGRDSVPLRGLNDLKGKIVGGELGLPYPPELDSIVGQYKAAKLGQLVKLLDTGRIDAFVAYTPDILRYFQDHGMEPYTYDPASPVAIYSDSLTCRPTDRNHDLMLEINEALQGLLY